MDRLTERYEHEVLVNGGRLCADYFPSEDQPFYEDYRAALEKLCDYEDAEEQGLLIRLPCRVGDELWVTKDQEKFPAKRMVQYVSWLDSKIQIIVQSPRTGIISHFNGDDFGKIIFLSKEEAEAALK